MPDDREEAVAAVRRLGFKPKNIQINGTPPGPTDWRVSIDFGDPREAFRFIEWLRDATN